MSSEVSKSRSVVIAAEPVAVEFPARPQYESAKRFMDVTLSALGLVFALPVMLVIAAAIKLDRSGATGPVLFVQWRAGREGKPFRMYKFRTMVDGAEGMRANLVRERELHEPVLKFEHDPRVTRVGRVLRRWSLDELPQLYNVLRGEMSMVGPRPEELRVVSMYSDWHRLRLSVIPGITGPMQVSGRASLPLDERVKVELAYIERASIWEDIWLLLRTMPAVLSGDGSF